MSKKSKAPKISDAVVENDDLPCVGCRCTRRTVSVNRSQRHATFGCTRCRARTGVDFAPDCLRAFTTPEQWIAWAVRLGDTWAAL